MPYKDIEKRRAFHRKYQARWKAENPEKWAETKSAHEQRRVADLGIEEVRRLNREKAAAWRKRNPKRSRELLRESYRKNYSTEQKYRRLKKYGLTHEAFCALLEEQKNRCAICGESFEGKRLHVDHCHKGKHVRGLLCSTCNSGLGHFKDNEEFLMNAVKYLKARGR